LLGWSSWSTTIWAKIQSNKCNGRQPASHQRQMCHQAKFVLSIWLLPMITSHGRHSSGRMSLPILVCPNKGMFPLTRQLLQQYSQNGRHYAMVSIHHHLAHGLLWANKFLPAIELPWMTDCFEKHGARTMIHKSTLSAMIQAKIQSKNLLQHLYKHFWLLPMITFHDRCSAVAECLYLS